MKTRKGQINVPPVFGRAFPPCEKGGENTPLLLFRFPYISRFPISLTAMDAFSRLSLIFYRITTAVGVFLIFTSSAERMGSRAAGKCRGDREISLAPLRKGPGTILFQFF